MSDDDAASRIHRIRGFYANGINAIAAWNKLIPGMAQADENLAWIETTLRNSPVTVVFDQNETLIDYLDKTEQTAGILGTIPMPPNNIGPVINTSGTAIVSVYAQCVGELPNRFPNEAHVLGWANETLHLGRQLRVMQNRADIAHQRLNQINPFLAQLHEEATHASFSAQAGTQNPIEAGATLNRLLEQFKGALIARCRTGKGTNYDRISDNLAANSPLTKTVVSDGQNTYNQLNDDLVEIRKHISPASGARMVELLRKFEEHVIVVTDALDPNVIGITFVT